MYRELVIQSSQYYAGLRELCTLDVSTSEVYSATFDLRDV